MREQSAQSTFNKVVRFLLKQRRKSGDSHLCLYRSPKGLKCAIGCLIPDTYYNPEMEGTTPELYGPLNPLSKVLLKLGYRNFRLLCDLQNIHDNRHPNQWKKCFTQYAAIRGLRMPKLEER